MTTTFHWHSGTSCPTPRRASGGDSSRTAEPSGWWWRRAPPCWESRELPVSYKSGPGNVCQETSAYCWSFHQERSPHSRCRELWCNPACNIRTRVQFDEEVHLGIEHDLGRPVPPGGHVLGQHARVVVAGVANSRQPEVADLNICVRSGSTVQEIDLEVTVRVQ